MYFKTGINLISQRFDIDYVYPFNLVISPEGNIITGRFADVRYYEIPLLLSLKVKESKLIDVYHSVGISNNVLSKIKYESLSFKKPLSMDDRIWSKMTDDFNTKINNYVIGAVFSVHFDIKLYKNFGLNGEASINYGLSNYYKECNISTMIIYNFKAGIFYNLEYKKE